MPDWIEEFTAHQDKMTNLLMELINRESFTEAVDHVNQLVDFIAAQMKALNPDELTRYPRNDAGDCLLGKWYTHIDAKPILLLVHMDTVHPIGTLETFPIRVEDGKLYGPGSLDMKASITLCLSVLEAFQAGDVTPARPVWLLATSDEETGSKAADDLIRETATQCDLVLVMEPALPGGDLKGWRKGGGTYRLTVKGRPSHAGIEPEKGLNAVVELAKQIVTLDALNDLKNGTSVSVTVVQGGTARNVIPEHASAMIDMRTLDQLSFDHTHDRIMNLIPNMPGVDVSVELLNGRPPMEFNSANQAAVAQVKAIAQSTLNMDLKADGTGGMSDANYTSSLGIATVDGLGPIGAGTHTLDEYVSLYSMPRRAALLAAILTQWGSHQ